MYLITNLDVCCPICCTHYSYYFVTVMLYICYTLYVMIKLSDCYSYYCFISKAHVLSKPVYTTKRTNYNPHSFPPANRLANLLHIYNHISPCKYTHIHAYIQTYMHTCIHTYMGGTSPPEEGWGAASTQSIKLIAYMFSLTFVGYWLAN